MLAKSDFDLVTALQLLGRHGIEGALLVPTPTGLEKSIFDATEEVRDYLLAVGYHDYSAQLQGSDHKVKRIAHFVRPRSLEPSNVSMYRPPTKSGDPRIWLGSATRPNARACNLLALTVQGGSLYVLNLSEPAVRASLDDPTSPFRKILDANRPGAAAAEELLGRLREISRKGFVRTLRAGDTGVGMTLETLLEIRANSSQAPDFKGIELKARRSGRAGQSSNRSTLFSKVPNWKLSPVGSAMGLLERRGYVEAGRLQLYQTISGRAPNRKGLQLSVDGERDWLMQVCEDPGKQTFEHDVTWELPKLRADLAAKHQQTFWVRANCRGHGATEEFHYVEVRHTRAPLVANFGALIEAGIVTLDYALHLEGNRARDHGYLFKIHPRSFGALFPPPELHDLS